MDLQHAETATEGDLLLGADALVAEHHHVVLQVRAMNAGKILVIERLAQIEAKDFSAQASERRRMSTFPRDSRTSPTGLDALKTRVLEPCAKHWGRGKQYASPRGRVPTATWESIDSFRGDW